MDELNPGEPTTPEPSSGIRTFLIADLRGYTRFTDEHGDEAAAQLTTNFLSLAREAISSREGHVVDVRGDEVLAFFDSPREGIRAALDLVAAVEAGSSEELPMLVGIGLDVGEAVAVEGGYRGMALNMAARLCAKARPGEILITPELAHLAGSVPGLVFEDRGPVRLKGLSRSIRLHAVVAYDGKRSSDMREARHGAIGFRVLGPLEVLEEGRPIPLGGPKQRLVLAHLILNADRVVPIEQLIDDLWDDDPPESARNSIQSYISHLRAALGAERIEGKAPGYVLRAEPDEVDSLRFERLLRRARRHVGIDPAQAVVAFEEALALWVGPPLADLSDHASLASAIARLEDLRLGAIEELIGARLALGEHAAVIPELELVVAQNPLRERAWGNLMLAQYRSGRQGEALETFGRARRLLADELGIDPSAELRELHERMLKQDPSLELKGRALRSYRLLEPIGEGAFGVVWRALDPSVGREVAVKQIQPRLADDPAFIRRFEQEAQSVARIEHPYVVPLYDFWRDGSGAYLVMRLMRGGSLAEALERGSLPLETVADVIDHIAAALSAAHRQRLVHRDVRPENVLLDEDGNAYLSDFGLADDQTSTGSGLAGPSGLGYRAPEQVRGEGATPRSDIFALGMLLSSMLGGRGPDGVAEIVSRATADDPTERFADAPEMAERLRLALNAGGPQIAVAAVMAERARNPYKGLRAFSEADASDFFGRNALVDRLVTRLTESGDGSRFLAVVGPSGGGKSSAVRAGLLPALRGGAIADSERWFYADMLPGARPMEELEAALLRVAADPPASLLELLERDERGLSRAAERALSSGGELLLVIDQFEELFTLVGREEDRTRFLECLVTAVTEPGSMIRVIATLRADFYDRPLAYPGFAELIRARTETVVPLSSEELERAIAGPAESVGAVTELSLVAEVVGDVTDQPGALPLMQYALTETFERRRDGVLTLEAYREVGGVTGAIARRAEELLTAMNPAGREAARQLFLRLVSIGEGSEDTRRLVARTELGSLEVDPDAMDAVIDVFGRHRLLTFNRDPDTRGPTVEVAHEALLREWGRLRGWIDAAREDVIMHRRLAAEAEEWERSSREPSFLLRGSRLTQFEGWLGGSALALSGDERRFLEESVRGRDVERVEEEARATRERALERRSRTRLWSLVAVLTVAVLVASLLTVAAAVQRARAQRATRAATARELASAATASLDVDQQRSVLLALQAIDATRQDAIVVPEATQALHAAVAADREILTLADPSTANVAWSPDGRLLATGGTVAGKDQTDVVVWDAVTGEKLLTLSGHTGDISYVAFSPDSARVVTTAGAPDERTIVWDAATGEQLLVVPGDGDLNEGARFSPDGTRIVIGEALADESGQPFRGIVRVVDASSGAQEFRRSTDQPLYAPPAFTPDGSSIALVIGGGNITFIDATTGAAERSLEVAGSGELAFSPDGATVVISDGTVVRIVSTRTGAQQLTIPQQGVIGVDWSADGRYIATGVSDGTARIWDAASGAPLLLLAGHSGLVALVAFSPDSTRLLTGGSDETARVWDIAPGGTAEWNGVTEGSAVTGVGYTPDGRLLTTGFAHGTWLRDADSGAAIAGYGDAWRAAAISADGTALATVGDKVLVRDPNSGVVRTTLAARGWRYENVAISADGTLVAATIDGVLKVWDASTGDVRATLGEPDGPLDAMVDVAFSPDGTLIAGISGLATLYIWDAPTGDELQRFQAQSGFGGAVVFAPDGKSVLTGGGDGAARWSLAGNRLAAYTGIGRVNGLAISPSGRLIATAGDDGITRVWSAGSGRRLLDLSGPTAAATATAFDLSGSKIATVSEDGTIRVFVLPVDQLVRIAKSRLTRGLTVQECRQYLHVPVCPVSASGGGGGSVSGSPTPAGGPEGAYRVTLQRGDVPVPPMHPGDRAEMAGVYSWSLVDGRWHFHQDRADGNTDDWSGTYVANADRIEFTTDVGDPSCLGFRFFARWTFEGPSALSFTDVSSLAEPTSCGPQALIDAGVRTLLASHPWQRIS